MADKIAVLTGGAGKMGGGICRALEKVGITAAAATNPPASSPSEPATETNT